MKCELRYDNHRYEFFIEPETKIEECALEYLASRPTNQVIVVNTRLGIFKREAKDVASP